MTKLQNTIQESAKFEEQILKFLRQSGSGGGSLDPGVKMGLKEE